MRIAASGVNFIDVYFRTGLYKADLPVTLGSEAAGTVEAVGSERDARRAGRPRRLRDGSRLVRRVRRRARSAAREASRHRRFPVGGGSHAAGHDRALPDPFDVPAGRRPDVPRARRGRRRRPAHRSDGQSPRRAGARHGVVGGEGGRRRCGRRRSRRSTTPRRRSMPRSGVSPTATASTSSTTRSARRRSSRAWRACARAECWCCSASRAAR